MKLLSPAARIVVATALALTRVTAYASDGDPHAHASCNAIPDDRYVTGLLGNPEGMQTYFERSRCFQEDAQRLREPFLCRQVRQRKSLFFDGSAYSPNACMADVARQVRDDMSAAAALRGPQRVDRIALARNGNGHDFDVLVHTTGGEFSGMHLQLSLVDGPRERVFYDQIQALDDLPDDIVLFVRRAELVGALPGHSLDGHALMRGRLVKVPSGEDERAIYSHATRFLRPSVAEVDFDPQKLGLTP